MGTLSKRLERLEAIVSPTQIGRLRIIVEFVAAIDGRPAPRDLKWARAGRREDQDDIIFRDHNEPMEVFEARAGEHFPGDFMIGPGMPS